MTRKKNFSLHRTIVKLCIWSIHHQQWLAGQVRIYLFGAAAVVAFLGLTGMISIQTTIVSTFCGAGIILGLLWFLIQQRRLILLNLKDPDLRAQAHRAMLLFLHRIGHKETAETHTGPAPSIHHRKENGKYHQP